MSKTKEKTKIVNPYDYQVFRQKVKVANASFIHQKETSELKKLVELQKMFDSD